MGNCFGKESYKYMPLNTTLLESDIQLDPKQRQKMLCELTELPVSQCNCPDCLEAAPPTSISGRPIKFIVERDRLYCRYHNTNELVDITDEKAIFCKRGGVIRSILFNGQQFAFR